MEIKHQSEVIEWLRFILAVLVVFMHAPIIGIDNYSENINSGGVIPVLMILIKRGIGSVAVPTFFFISGYLFYVKLQDWDWDVFGQKIKKRIRTVLFPYLLWNILTVLFFILVIFADKRSLNAVCDFCIISIVLLVGILFSFGNYDSAYKILWPLFTVSGVLATICIASFLLRNTLVSVHHNLSNSSFFLFAAHFPLINYLAYLINCIFYGNSMFLHTVKYLATPIILILILEICYFSMKRYSSRLLDHLTGGR